MRLDDAVAIRVGDEPVVAAHLGADLVWEPGGDPEPPGVELRTWGDECDHAGDGQPWFRVPAAAEVGDLCLVAITAHGDAPITAGPTGWDLVAQGSDGPRTLTVYARVLTAGQPGSQVGFTIAQAWWSVVALTAVYTGGELGPVGAVAGNGDWSDTPTATGPTVAAGTEAVAFVGVLNNSGVTASVASPWTLRIQSDDNSNMGALATLTVGSAGAVPSAVWSLSNGGGNNSAVIVAIIP